MRHQFLMFSMLFGASLFASNDCVTYEVSGGPVLLQPNTSNLYYGAVAHPIPLPSPHWESLEILPDYHFGFEVGVKACFDRINARLQLDWERMHSSDSASKNVPNNVMVGPYFNIGPDADHYKMAEGHVHHQFDAVNLNFSKQCICCGDFQADFFAGVAFTRIKQTLKSHFSNVEETITRQVEAPTQFMGAGPQFGVDFAYNFCRGFSLTGETSLAMLMGVVKNSTTFLSNSPLLIGLGITPPNKQTTSVPDRTQLVPGYYGKLGLSYTTCCKGHVTTINLGYQVQAYINAIQSVDMSDEVEVPPFASEVGVFALGFQRTVSNFLLTGPYFNLDISF